MEIRSWDKPLSEFLDMLGRNDVRINKRYQRSGKVYLSFEDFRQTRRRS
jgi:hypothetical protein